MYVYSMLIHQDAWGQHVKEQHDPCCSDGDEDKDNGVCDMCQEGLSRVRAQARSEVAHTRICVCWYSFVTIQDAARRALQEALGGQRDVLAGNDAEVAPRVVEPVLGGGGGGGGGGGWRGGGGGGGGGGPFSDGDEPGTTIITTAIFMGAVLLLYSRHLLAFILARRAASARKATSGNTVTSYGGSGGRTPKSLQARRAQQAADLERETGTKVYLPEMTGGDNKGAGTRESDVVNRWKNRDD